MTTRRVDYLITDTRLSTENQDFSDTIGIKDSEFLRYINDAQVRVHGKIIKQHPSVFVAEKVENIVGNQESYTLPSDIYAGNKITMVEYSPTSSDNDYYVLQYDSIRNRDKGSMGDPVYYMRKSGTVMLKPVPTSSRGKLRISYIRKIPRLDTIRGVVATATLDSGTNTITTLELNVSTEVVDSNELNKFTRMSIVDEEGEVQMQNIKYTNVNSSTGVVTVDPSFTYTTGETISVGDNVVAGSYSSTHSELDDLVERYLIEYATMKILQRDSSSDLTSQFSILQSMEQDIIDSYAELTDDIVEIPDIISYDDQWDIF